MIAELSQTFTEDSSGEIHAVLTFICSGCGKPHSVEEFFGPNYHAWLAKDLLRENAESAQRACELLHNKNQWSDVVDIGEEGPIFGDLLGSEDDVALQPAVTPERTPERIKTPQEPMIWEKLERRAPQV